jgi:hypothetical protein
MNSEPLPDFAPQWLAQRRLGYARLEELKLEELRQMTESDAARIFAMLDPPRPYALRPSSGLVEQQRWFMLARTRQLDAERGDRRES